MIMVSKTEPGNELEQQKHYFTALLSAIRRGWRIAIPLGICLSVICTYAAWLSFVPKYAASAYLRIDSDNPPLIFKTADESAGRGNDFALYKNTHQQLLVTPFVLNAALRDTQVSSLAEINSNNDPIGWLQANLKVSFPGNGEIMQVSAQTLNPVGCVQVVNGVVNAFMQEVVLNERNDRLKRLNNLELVYAEAENKVRNKRGELKSMATAAGTSDSQSLSVAQQSVLTQFGRMAEKLGEIQFALMQAEGEFRIAEDLERRQNEERKKEAVLQLEFGNGSQLPSEVNERPADVVQLEEEIALANSKLKALLKDFGMSHPTVVNSVRDMELKNQLLEIRKTEAKKRSKLSEGKVKNTAESKAYDLLNLATRTQVLANQEKILKEKVDKLSEETRQLGKSSIDVELMRAEISGLEGVLNRVGEEKERTLIELKTSSRIKLLSPAVSSSPPDSSKRLARALVLGVFGFAAPFGMLIMWDLARKKVINGEVTSHSLSLPTIGTIPKVAMNPLQRGAAFSRVSWNRSQAELDEALDGLASMLLHSSQTQNCKVFMISSAMPGEGKSTVACQLAQALANAGKSVVLVDFDLRRPSIHRYLKLRREPGLAESLNKALPFEEAIQESDTANLSVMTAGEWSGNLHERCTSGSVDELFHFLRSSFDIVIVDSSPILSVHDSQLVGRFTDGVVLTLVRDRSRLPAAAQACEILKFYKIPVLGTIIIGVNSRIYPGYYSNPSKGHETKALVTN